MGPTLPASPSLELGLKPQYNRIAQPFCFRIIFPRNEKASVARGISLLFNSVIVV